MIERGMGDYANPDSILKAAAMLLRHICRGEAAEKLENAMSACPVAVSYDAGVTCMDYADAVMGLL